jgi:hypothetical protein
MLRPEANPYVTRGAGRQGRGVASLTVSATSTKGFIASPGKSTSLAACFVICLPIGSCLEFPYSPGARTSGVCMSVTLDFRRVLLLEVVCSSHSTIFNSLRTWQVVSSPLPPLVSVIFQDIKQSRRVRDCKISVVLMQLSSHPHRFQMLCSSGFDAES